VNTQILHKLIDGVVGMTLAEISKEDLERIYKEIPTEEGFREITIPRDVDKYWQWKLIYHPTEEEAGKPHLVARCQKKNYDKTHWYSSNGYLYEMYGEHVWSALPYFVEWILTLKLELGKTQLGPHLDLHKLSEEIRAPLRRR
jgi:hypothetical protein